MLSSGTSNGAFAEHESAEKIVEDSQEYEKCSLQEENKSNDEYEVPCISKANTKTKANHYETSLNEGIEFLDKGSVKFPNTTNDKPLDGKLARNYSRTLNEKCSLHKENKSSDEYEVLSITKANAKTDVNHSETSVSEGIEFIDEESVKFQNTFNDKPLDGRQRRDYSKSAIFMKSVMPEQKALSDLKVVLYIFSKMSFRTKYKLD